MDIKTSALIALAAILTLPIGSNLVSMESQNSQLNNSASLIDENLALVDRWIEARRTLSEEQAEWEAESVHLEDLIALRTQQLSALEANIVEIDEAATEADRRLQEVDASLSALDDVEAAVVKIVEAAEVKVNELIKQLPPPLAQEIEPLVVRLDQVEELSASQRMQTVVGIVSQVEKFNTVVDLQAGPREVDGKMILVSSIYFGLGGAFWSDAEGLVGGVGIPTEEGYVWERQDEIAPYVAKMAAMWNGETTQIEFVTLPVEVR